MNPLPFRAGSGAAGEPAAVQPAPHDPAPSALAPGAYQPALDGLRAVAILMVIAYHDRLLSGGFLGVQVFFVLSGYLITTLLEREHEASGTIRLGRFYARRFLRLAPALVLFVLVAWGITHGLKPELAPSAKGSWALAALFYVSNLVIAYGGTYPLGLFSITWSLALEEQFYLLWPAALRGLRRGRLPRRGLVVLLAGLVAACVALRWALLATRRDDPDLWLRVYFGPDTGAEGLLWGCLLALLAPTDAGAGASARRERAAGAVGLLGAGLLAVLALRVDMHDLVAQPLLLTLVAASSCALILGALGRSPLRRVLELPPLVWIGQLSYSLYLWHALAIELLVHEPRGRRYALMLGLALASHYLVERPALRLGRRLGALPRPHAWSLRAAAGARAGERAGLACGVAGLAVAATLCVARFTGAAPPGLELAPLVQARERSVDGEHERALEQYERAAARSPGDARVAAEHAEALVRAGLLALERERPQDALVHLRRAAALRPDDGELRNHLGVALARTGRLDAALAQFQEAVRLGAGAVAQENLARARRAAARASAR